MKKLLALMGIDRAVLFTLMLRGWNIFSGLLTIVFVVRTLSPELQGYYYTFNGLIALQIFAELGLSFAIIQFSSHEMAQLSWQQDGTVSGSHESKRRLQSLLHFVFSWFGVASVLLIVVLLPAGLYFFSSDSLKTAEVSRVSLPWTLLVIFSAVNLFITSATAILEGCGKVSQVAAMRLWQSIFAMSTVWIILSLGGELYALAVSSMMIGVSGLAWLWIKHRIFFKDLIKQSTELPGMSWRREIWPFQWRIAVSWMSGYLIFQLFTPLIFKTHGPVSAGQMGMSLQIISALNGAAMAWISPKAPLYGQLIATNQRRLLDSLFLRGFTQSLVFLLIAVSSVWIALYFMERMASAYALRVVPLSLFSLLCVVCIANHIIFAEAAYLRAHKQDPMMELTVFAGLVTAVLASFLVPALGVAGAVYSYAATTLFIGLSGSTAIFFYKRREWTQNY
jgi:O-antigen/teichoic acid export membrane protein